MFIVVTVAVGVFLAVFNRIFMPKSSQMIMQNTKTVMEHYKNIMMVMTLVLQAQ